MRRAALLSIGLITGIFWILGVSLPSYASNIKPTDGHNRARGFITYTTYLPIINNNPPPDVIVTISPYENRPEFSNYVTYFGEFINNTGQPVMWVDADFAFYDSGGQVIGIDDTLNSSMTFAHGDRICWSLWVRKSWGPPVLHSKEYYLTQFANTAHNVVIQNTRLITDPLDFKVIGEFYNGGPNTIYSMRVTTTLHNSEGEVVGCDPFNWPSPDPLSVGGTAIFEATSFYDADKENVTNYSWYANFRMPTTFRGSNPQ